MIVITRRDLFYPKKKLDNRCPICNDSGYVWRPPGFQGNERPARTPCAAGPPYHKSK